MRTALLLTMLIAGLAIAWWWLAASAPPPPASAPSPTPPSATTTAPPPSIAATDRLPAGDPLGTIRGRVVDDARQPLAGAIATLVHDSADAEGQQATTGADGRFTLFRAPLAACAVRIDAAGFCAAQLGDLHPEQAEHHDVDLGDFVLRPAVLCTGLVQTGGRPLAGAKVTLRPRLGEPGAPLPLVQRTTSGADGTFHFAQGVPPPGTIEVTADGYEPVPARELEAPPRLLVFELVPRARLRGRVIAAETGAGVPFAPLWLVPLDSEPKLVMASGDRGTASLYTDRDGHFDLAPPPSPWFVVETGGDGCVPTISAGIENKAPLAPLELRLARGVTVIGTVTWRGDPVAGTAALRARSGWPVTLAPNAFGADGTFRLPPCAPGTWLLRVDGAHGAHHEQELQLELPGPLQLAIELTAGAPLIGRVTGGGDWSTVVARHEHGQLRKGLRQADGSYRIEGLAPGRWTAFVLALGNDWHSVASNQLLAALPHPEVRIDGEAEVRLDLQSPTGQLGSLRGRVGAEFAGSRIELVRDEPGPRRIPPTLLRTDVAGDGTFVLDPVLPGEWVVELRRDGQATPLRTTRVQVLAGASAECRFD
ncbi:MAG: carboxypeptidase-like regulatory domain-containing protein [Planctomycetes bacterium]|nr:carboxypeptidase-like regulatory domain-containing protein [Planctomycetota bacterium]